MNRKDLLYIVQRVITLRIKIQYIENIIFKTLYIVF